jgi:peptide/nickel transport system ATP-binding protein
LLAAIPEPDPSDDAIETNFIGETGEMIERPKGCVFYRCCPIAEEICATEEPQMREIDENQEVACHFAD